MATLSRLRSAVAESVEAPPISLAPRRRWYGHWTAIAAGVALVLLVAGSLAMCTLGRPAGPGWLD